MSRRIPVKGIDPLISQIDVQSVDSMQMSGLQFTAFVEHLPLILIKRLQLKASFITQIFSH